MLRFDNVTNVETEFGRIKIFDTLVCLPDPFLANFVGVETQSLGIRLGSYVVHVPA